MLYIIIIIIKLWCCFWVVFLWVIRVLFSKEYVCVCMRDVISEFNSEIEGSLAFCALLLFLCSILCLMCSGSSLHVE